ncbi:MAG: hypothetical protein JJ975_03570 [Bacteroidia bacterium]|nr:hypothetical protein [Bacteroidia bacterium]
MKSKNNNLKTELVEKCNACLENGEFPDVVLDGIREKRLRENVIRDVFMSRGKRFEELTEHEQKETRRRVKVKSAFEDYYRTLLLFKSTVYLAFAMGIIIWVTADIGTNLNHMFGIITSLIGLGLFVATWFHSFLHQYGRYIAVVLLVAYVIEKLTLGLPDTLLFPVYSVSAAGGLIGLVNEMTPYIYELVRLLTVGFSFKMVSDRSKFERLKKAFEEGHSVDY